jgi:hypothetical protein
MEAVAVPGPPLTLALRTSDLRGRVTNAGGAILRVTLTRGAASWPGASTQTDGQGYFVVPSVSHGTWFVCAGDSRRSGSWHGAFDGETFVEVELGSDR